MNSSQLNDFCTHEHTNNDKDIITCIDCGEEIFQKILHEKEWKYSNTEIYNVGGVRKTIPDERSIDKDLEYLNFNEAVVVQANKFYREVTKGKIFRGNSRKGYVFACIFYSFKYLNDPQSYKKLIQMFGIDPKIGLQGVKSVRLALPKIDDLKNSYITPINLIDEITTQFNSTENQKEQIKKIYEIIRNKSPKLNRCRPQSIASGIVYYWILLNNKEITLADFAQKVSLGESTINKIVKEITEIIG